MPQGLEDICINSANVYWAITIERCSPTFFLFKKNVCFFFVFLFQGGREKEQERNTNDSLADSDETGLWQGP